MKTIKKEIFQVTLNNVREFVRSQTTNHIYNKAYNQIMTKVYHKIRIRIYTHIGFNIIYDKIMKNGQD